MAKRRRKKADTGFGRRKKNRILICEIYEFSIASFSKHDVVLKDEITRFFESIRTAGGVEEEQKLVPDTKDRVCHECDLVRLQMISQVENVSGSAFFE